VDAAEPELEERRLTNVRSRRSEREREDERRQCRGVIDAMSRPDRTPPSRIECGTSASVGRICFVALRPRGRTPTAVGAAAASVALLAVGVLVAMGKYAPAVRPAPRASRRRPHALAGERTPTRSRSLSRCRRGLGFDALLARRESARGRIDGATLAVLTVVGTIAAATAAAAFADGLGLVRAVTGASPPASLDAAFVTGDARRSAAFLVVGVLALAVAAFRPAPRALGAGLVLLVSFANLHVLSREIQFVGDDSLLRLPRPWRRARRRTEPRVTWTRGTATPASASYGSHDAAAFAPPRPCSPATEVFRTASPRRTPATR